MIDLTSKIYAEISYVKMIMQNSMLGKAMTTLCATLDKVMTLLDYFASLTADCFGDN